MSQLQTRSKGVVVLQPQHRRSIAGVAPAAKVAGDKIVHMVPNARFWHKGTLPPCWAMSAFGGKADIAQTSVNVNLAAAEKTAGITERGRWGGGAPRRWGANVTHGG